MPLVSSIYFNWKPSQKLKKFIVLDLIPFYCIKQKHFEAFLMSQSCEAANTLKNYNSSLKHNKNMYFKHCQNLFNVLAIHLEVWNHVVLFITTILGVGDIEKPLAYEIDLVTKGASILCKFCFKIYMVRLELE